MTRQLCTSSVRNDLLADVDAGLADSQLRCRQQPDDNGHHHTCGSELASLRLVDKGGHEAEPEERHEQEKAEPVHGATFPEHVAFEREQHVTILCARELKVTHTRLKRFDEGFTREANALRLRRIRVTLDDGASDEVDPPFRE